LFFFLIDFERKDSINKLSLTIIVLSTWLKFSLDYIYTYTISSCFLMYLIRLFEKLVEEADEKKKAFAEFEKYDLKLREVRNFSLKKYFLIGIGI